MASGSARSMRLAAALLLVPCAASALNLTQVARLSAANHFLAFGDSDHDGHNEIFYSWRDASYHFSYRIYEEQGNNHYTQEYQGALLYPYALGDLDGDGKSDLVGQWDSLKVYEAISSSTYPTQRVWSHPAPNILGATSIADTDRDGRMEIVYFMHGVFAAQLSIFEAAGDNTYNLVYTLLAHCDGGAVIGDFDDDGLTEIAFSGYKSPLAGSELTIVESSANDAWGVTFTDSTGLADGGNGQGGRDTDGNGKPELFFSGHISNAAGGAHAAVIYEPCGDNCFERVALLVLDDRTTGIAPSALGNLDGVGPEEYLLEVSRSIGVYRPVAPGQWTLIDQIDEPPPNNTHSYIALFDVNNNGRPELIWPTSASDAESTLVFEQVELPTSTPLDALRLGPAFAIVPNPCSVSAIVAAPNVSQAVAWVSVYDAAGRLVDRTISRPSTNGRFLWTARGTASGVYYLRLEDKFQTPLAAGRVTVIR